MKISDELKNLMEQIEACTWEFNAAECEIIQLPTDDEWSSRFADKMQRCLWKQVAEMFEQVSLRDGVMNGEPCVADTRIPVSIVVSMVGEGRTCEEVAEDYGAITVEQVREAVLFAARLTWYI